MAEHRAHTRVLHTAIRKALIEKWDPIGVKNIPEAQDEYDHYVPAICNLLVTRRSKQELFDYLWWLETHHMGLSGDRLATEAFAQHLQGLAEQWPSLMLSETH